MDGHRNLFPSSSNLLVMRKLLFVCLLLAGALPAHALLDARVLDAQLVQRYCAGMILQQYTLPDKTEADCISETHAIEVDKSTFWYDSLAQSLHYALWTRDIAEQPDAFEPWSAQIDKPLKAGIILVCMRPRDPNDPNDLCTEHYARLFRIIEEYRLPVTIWDCNYPADAALSDCQKIDMPPAVVEKVE